MCSCNLVFCRPPQNRCTVATCACQASPDKAQYVLCLVWMSEWCLLIGSLFTLGFIFRAFPLSQSTYDLQGRNWDHKYPWECCGPFSASITNKIKVSKTNMSSVWIFWQRQCQMVMVTHIDISSKFRVFRFLGFLGCLFLFFKCMMAFEFELIFVFAWMVDSKGLPKMNDICMNV